MAVKNDRVRIYALEDVGIDGAVDMQYVRQPSNESDEAYWAGLAYITGHEKSVGAQAEHVVSYDLVMDDHVPVENTSDIIIARLGADNEETQFLKVLSVGYLRTTGEKIARCLDVSDAAYTLTSN
jgi:hypothetical protein